MQMSQGISAGIRTSAPLYFLFVCTVLTGLYEATNFLLWFWHGNIWRPSGMSGISVILYHKERINIQALPLFGLKPAGKCRLGCVILQQS